MKSQYFRMVEWLKQHFAQCSTFCPQNTKFCKHIFLDMLKFKTIWSNVALAIYSKFYSHCERVQSRKLDGSKFRQYKKSARGLRFLFAIISTNTCCNNYFWVFGFGLGNWPSCGRLEWTFGHISLKFGEVLKTFISRGEAKLESCWILPFCGQIPRDLSDWGLALDSRSSVSFNLFKTHSNRSTTNRASRKTTDMCQNNWCLSNDLVNKLCRERFQLIWVLDISTFTWHIVRLCWSTLSPHKREGLRLVICMLATMEFSHKWICARASGHKNWEPYKLLVDRIMVIEGNVA